MALWLDPLGTSDLLVGKERLAWGARAIERSPVSDLGATAGVDPREGQREFFSRRMGRAREWDERRRAPMGSHETPVVTQAAKGEMR
jgi:hypothetical protein